MNRDSMPEIETAPSFEDIVTYAVNEGLFGKISLTKFFDYYSKTQFMYQGRVMDWKQKLHEWAKRQSSQPIITEREYSIRNKLTAKKEDSTFVSSLWAKVAAI